MNSKITNRELLDICERYSDALRSDANCDVHYGCDCGCGGDLYTLDDFELMCKEFDEAEQAFKELCEKLGIDFDIYGGNTWDGQ